MQSKANSLRIRASLANLNYKFIIVSLILFFSVVFILKFFENNQMFIFINILIALIIIVGAFYFKRLANYFTVFGFGNKVRFKKLKALIIKEKRRSLNQFAVSINHSINNPLTCVLADIQIALNKLRKDKELSDKLKGIIACLETAEKEALRIKATMEKTRDMTHPCVKDYVSGIKMIDIERSCKKDE